MNVSIRHPFKAATRSSSGHQTPGSPLNSGGLPISICGLPGADVLPRRAFSQVRLFVYRKDLYFFASMSASTHQGSPDLAKRLPSGRKSMRSCEHIPHQRNHLAAIKLDAAHELVVRERAGAVFKVEAHDAERLGGRGDLAGDRLRRAEMERAALDLAIEFGAPDRRPAALGADAVVHALVGRPVFLTRLFVGRGDKSRRVHRDLLRRPAELLEGAMVEIDIGPEALGIAADDGERQR